MRLNKLLFVLILCGYFSAQSFALSTDKDQPVEVEADNFTLDDAKKLTTYSGDVIITQGSMRIEADKISIHNSSGKTDKVVANGRPVKFQQQPDGNQALVRGEASQFNYLLSKDTLVMTGNATLWQKGSKFSSDRIEYDSKRSIIKGGAQKGGNSKRVKIILQPSKSKAE
ncbi:MAG: lipopolysaccharide transport periplasmic protein LptA [Cycloclasticus sp. symbiont of Poecilosclerida sp. M]|nr:MAG: lipopolysaccharide transport periplasmic protein LptA [Cycloclasticus sp. symbiont of Poecilosclerida sp. M]